MNKLFGREPAAFLALAHALIALAIGFGLDLSTEQFGLVEAALASLVGLIVRSQVTPAGNTG